MSPPETKSFPLAAPACGDEATPALRRPVTSLWGVGAERAAQLARLDIRTVEDLLLHRSRRYEDRRQFLPIAQLQLGEPVTTRGAVVALGVKWFKQHTKSIFELILDDGTARLHCRWWNLPFMEKYFAVGDEVIVFGKPLGLTPRTMDHPETEVVEDGEEQVIHFSRLTPIYPLTDGLPQRWLRSLIWRTLNRLEGQIPEPWPGTAGLQVAGCKLQVSAEPAATSESAANDVQPETGNRHPATILPTRAQAIRMLHFPETVGDTVVAVRRLALDEFVELQRRILLRRKHFETKARALPCGGDNHLIKPFLARLRGKLTGAQTKVLRELRRDLSGTHPMRRLLQGDVGSGKTVVAACCALMALESGYHVALMAPTEVLAEQHFGNFTNWLEPLGVAVELQTGSRKTLSVQSPKSNVQSREPEAGVQRQPTLTIGTHSLIEAGFAPENLGLVIIDEQHKFGVAQREQLVRKGNYPHLLVMTATPIPRTLGLTLYGELDVLIIDEQHKFGVAQCEQLVRKGNYPHLLVMTATPIPRTLGLTLYGELDVSVIDELPPGRGSIKTFVRAADKLPKVWAFIRDKLAEGRQAYVV